MEVGSKFDNVYIPGMSPQNFYDALLWLHRKLSKITPEMFTLDGLAIELAQTDFLTDMCSYSAQTQKTWFDVEIEGHDLGENCLSITMKVIVGRGETSPRWTYTINSNTTVNNRNVYDSWRKSDEKWREAVTQSLLKEQVSKFLTKMWYTNPLARRMDTVIHSFPMPEEWDERVGMSILTSLLKENGIDADKFAVGPSKIEKEGDYLHHQYPLRFWMDG